MEDGPASWLSCSFQETGPGEECAAMWLWRSWRNSECAVSSLNREVVQKWKKSTWSDQTDPFLFDLCQVTLKKSLYAGSHCRVKAAEPTSCGIQVERDSFFWPHWALSWTPYQRSPQLIDGLNGESSAHNLKPWIEWGADNAGVKGHWVKYD